MHIGDLSSWKAGGIFFFSVWRGCRARGRRGVSNGAVVWCDLNLHHGALCRLAGLGGRVAGGAGIRNPIGTSG